MSDRTIERRGDSIAGRRVMLVGKLASMSRREAEALVREHGGVVVGTAGESPDVVVSSDEGPELRRLAASDEEFGESFRARVAAGEVDVIGESELWGRLGLVDSGDGVARLYTAAMLAELVRAPIAAIRQWQRCGAIVAKREIQRLAYFDFAEVPVARKLARLLDAGRGLAAINRELESLSRALPDAQRPLADPTVVVEGGRLLVRREDGLCEPSGQLWIEFGAQPHAAGAAEVGPATISMVGVEALHKPAAVRGSQPDEAEDLRSLAAELDGSGLLGQAAEAYRAVLLSGESSADDHFALAEVLYASGDLPAARERYYVAIERDEDFVEARSNLGCVLAELGEFGLAEAAFRGALEYHPDYADAHYHLARLLDSAERLAEANCHWQIFMSLAPASPWADEARTRLTVKH